MNDGAMTTRVTTGDGRTAGVSGVGGTGGGRGMTWRRTICAAPVFSRQVKYMAPSGP